MQKTIHRFTNQLKVKPEIKWVLVIFILIFVAHVFLRFYDFEVINSFTWDQVDTAWVSKNMIVDHKFPLVGAPAKLNSGIYSGPLYYYYISSFYFFTNLDPIASGIAAGVASIITFGVIFYVIYKLFSIKVALIAVFIHAFSMYVVMLDRVQWQVNFLAPISFLIFYCLYNVVTGNAKFIIYLAIFLGLSFHIHFTAVFFPIIILFSLPFFPRSIKTLKYGTIGIFIVLLFLLGNIIFDLQKQASSTKSIFSYIQTYFHGFHVVRFLQVSNDAFIEFAVLTEKLPGFSHAFFIRFVLPLLFVFLYLYKKLTRNRILLCFLMLLWFLIPWIVFATYSGEITNYYFSITRPMVLIILSYVTYRMLFARFLPLRFVIVAFWLYFVVINIYGFTQVYRHGIKYEREKVMEAISAGRKIEFTMGDPQSYLYYVYTRNK